MKQSRKFAVTGGIGSGKSYVLARICAYGYPVFSCDEISRDLWEMEAYRKELLGRFPQCADGADIDKAKLTKLVFSDPAALARLEAFSHPRIMETLLARMEEHPVSFAEVPLLFEGGYEHLFEAVIAVRRPEEERIRAVMARDGVTEEQVRRRMARQLDPAELAQKPCFLLENGAHLEEDLRRFFQEYRL